jgi:hypothetical protein
MKQLLVFFRWYLFRRIPREIVTTERIRPCRCWDCKLDVQDTTGHSCPRCGAGLVSPLPEAAAAQMPTGDQI